MRIAYRLKLDFQQCIRTCLVSKEFIMFSLSDLRVRLLQLVILLLIHSADQFQIVIFNLNVLLVLNNCDTFFAVVSHVKVNPFLKFFLALVIFKFYCFKL